MNCTVKILNVAGLDTIWKYVGLPVGHKHKNKERAIAALSRLVAAGDEHAKLLRQVVVWVEITAPRYWLQQLATYRVGLEMYSGSTMHTLLRTGTTHGEFVGATSIRAIEALDDAIDTRDIAKAKANLPEGFLQTRLVMISFQTLRRIWLQRRRHKLGEWHEFLLVMHEIPYSGELIFVEPKNPWRVLWQSLLDDVGVLDDAKPDTLSVAGLTGAQCDEYTSAVLELLHKESAQ